MTAEILLFTLAMACPQVKYQNVTKFPWNEEDKKTLVQAQKRCGELYPDAPCVKLFRKFGERDYSVICGK